MFSRIWYVKYELACARAILCSTTSVPGFGPVERLRSHAYSGRVPSRRSVVLHLERSCARAATGGTMVGSVFRTVGGAGEERTRARRRWYMVDRDGVLGCRYARM